MPERSPAIGGRSGRSTHSHDTAIRCGNSLVDKRFYNRRNILDAEERERLAATSRTIWPLEKLLADVRPMPTIEQAAPASLPASDRKRWADERRAADEEAALARIDGMLRIASDLTVALTDGKLAFLIDEQEIARAFVSDRESGLVAAKWRSVALDFQPKGKDDARRLVDRLRRVAENAEPAVTEQIIAIGQELAILERVIRDDEAQLHELTCDMFNLTSEERALVENRRLN